MAEEAVLALCQECNMPMKVVFDGAEVVAVFKVCKCDTPAERYVDRETGDADG